MRTDHDGLQPSRATAIFGDGDFSFELPYGATLEYLADYVADLGELYGADPVAIEVEFRS